MTAPVVKIGVLLPQPPEELGEWLADATAFEAAGADALWINPGPDCDPLTLTAALAALTYRSLLVMELPSATIDTELAEAEPVALATVNRLSRGRLTLSADASDSWVRVPPPENRAAWRETLAAAAERGDHGLLVPADPRLLDLLRNPGDPGGRADLQLAQG
jgi:hypothetical protein